VPGVGPVPVGVVHLHSRAYEADEQIREREIEAILRLTAGHRDRGTPHLLCGDFNANSPTQKIDLDKAKPKTRDAWEANGGQIPRRTIGRLLTAGYVDTLKAAKGDAADETPSFTTDHPAQRSTSSSPGASVPRACATPGLIAAN
jgi:endonuclease/exonuclease/phosphatase family metal-dependent hydrolase